MTEMIDAVSFWKPYAAINIKKEHLLQPMILLFFLLRCDVLTLSFIQEKNKTKHDLPFTLHTNRL